MPVKNIAAAKMHQKFALLSVLHSMMSDLCPGTGPPGKYPVTGVEDHGNQEPPCHYPHGRGHGPERSLQHLFYTRLAPVEMMHVHY
jgi:hypothetical protein